MQLFKTTFSAILLLLPVSFALAQQPAWRLANETQGLRIKDIDIYPRDSDTLYAISTYEFVISTDRGENWQIIPNTIEGGASAALKVDPFDSRRIYASHYYSFQGGNGVSLSTDGGLNWQLLFTGTFSQAAVVEIDPLDYQTIYAGQGPSDIRKSTDHGQTWNLLPIDSTMFGFYDLAIASSNPKVLYAGYFTGIFKSSDGGYNWEKLPLGIQVTRPRVAVDPQDERIVYATSLTWGSDSAGVFKSFDGGLNWSAINNGLTQNDRDIYTIEINPKNPDEVYIGTSSPQNDLLFKTTDGGEDWFKFSSGLPNEGYTTSIVIDTLNRRLYAGVVSPGNLDGVYIYDGITSIGDQFPGIAESFTLQQNYPNPFNSMTTISYMLPRREYVTLKVYDVSGRQISTLLQGYEAPGGHNIMWSAEGLPGGVYFYKMTIGSHTMVRKALLIK